MHHIDQERPDLIVKQETQFLLNHQTQAAARYAQMLKDFKGFFTFISRAPYLQKYDSTQKQTLLKTLVNPFSAFSTIKVIHSQVFSKARERNSRYYLSFLKNAFKTINCPIMDSTKKLKKDNSVSEATIVEETDDTVVLNLNHPLAGKKLEYEVEVLEVVYSCI